MQVTGYKLLETIRQVELKRDMAKDDFSDTLYVFEGDEKPHPDEVAGEFIAAELQIVRLQGAQVYYNLAVEVDITIFGSDKAEAYSLAQVIKMVGAANRWAYMWKNAMASRHGRGRKLFSYQYDSPTERGKEREYAKPVLDRNELLDRARLSAKFASGLRAIIAEANTAKVDVHWLEPSDLVV